MIDCKLKIATQSILALEIFNLTIYNYKSDSVNYINKEPPHPTPTPDGDR
jgi:hypothetical protein